MPLNSVHSLTDLTYLALMHYFLNLPPFALIIRLKWSASVKLKVIVTSVC